MKFVPVVIGAGYGDEGKGIITSYITKTLNADMVCRFNGGAQAGHTVVKNDIRNSFHQFSSGTFEGANTYLSSDFILNPYLLNSEQEHIASLGYNPKLYVNKDVKVTTIFDMAINQIAELSRTFRHGSCGFGINETVTRNEFVNLVVTDLLNKTILVDKLESIYKEWIPERLDKLGITLNSYFHERTGNILLNDNFVAHANEMIKCVQNIELNQPVVNQLVCEGAQGLALDEFLGVFPHVTRSITGLPNAIKAIQSFGGNIVQPIYVTRSYTTRHGAGPLKHENEFISELLPPDETNVPNEMQQTLRYAPLNLNLLKDLISQDIKRSMQFDVFIQDPVLAITHLDFINEHSITLYDMNNNVKTIKGLQALVGFVEDQINIPVHYVGIGVNKVINLC